MTPVPGEVSTSLRCHHLPPVSRICWRSALESCSPHATVGEEAAAYGIGVLMAMCIGCSSPTAQSAGTTCPMPSAAHLYRRVIRAPTSTCAYRKSHPTFRRLHLQDLLLILLTHF